MAKLLNKLVYHNSKCLSARIILYSIAPSSIPLLHHDIIFHMFAEISEE